MTNAALQEMPEAGNPHIRFDEVKSASEATPRCGSLLIRIALGLRCLAGGIVPLSAAISIALAAASAVVAVICGMDDATARRYESRNDALRSIARRRDLPEYDVAALMSPGPKYAASLRSIKLAPCVFAATLSL